MTRQLEWRYIIHVRDWHLARTEKARAAAGFAQMEVRDDLYEQGYRAHKFEDLTERGERLAALEMKKSARK